MWGARYVDPTDWDFEIGFIDLAAETPTFISVDTRTLGSTFRGIAGLDGSVIVVDDATFVARFSLDGTSVVTPFDYQKLISARPASAGRLRIHDSTGISEIDARTLAPTRDNPAPYTHDWAWSSTAPIMTVGDHSFVLVDGDVYQYHLGSAIEYAARKPIPATVGTAATSITASDDYALFLGDDGANHYSLCGVAVAEFRPPTFTAIGYAHGAPPANTSYATIGCPPSAYFVEWGVPRVYGPLEIGAHCAFSLAATGAHSQYFDGVSKTWSDAPISVSIGSEVDYRLYGFE